MRTTKGFTLIELLVVISVIALLMGILMPALMKAKEHAKRMVCCNNVRILGMANTLYAEDADGWDVLGQDGITPYKEVGCDGPTLYRHSEGVNIAFYDGHVQHMKKDRVWNQDAWDNETPGMWSTFRNYPPTVTEQNRLPKP